MKGAHSAKKAPKPNKADKSKKKNNRVSGVALKVDPEIIKSTLAAKPTHDEPDQKPKKSNKSAHSAKKRVKAESHGRSGKMQRNALVVCIVIALIALAGLIFAFVTRTIDLPWVPSDDVVLKEQQEEGTGFVQGPSASSNTQQETQSDDSQFDNLIEDGVYHNPRFGFSVAIPEGFHIDSLIDNGDGVILTNDALEMTVSVSGSNNLDSQSAQDVLDSVWSKGGDSIGRAEDNRVIVYQYDDLSEYFYWIYVGTGSINRMVIEFPVHDANDTELKVSQELMRGFAPGLINRQH